MPLCRGTFAASSEPFSAVVVFVVASSMAPSSKGAGRRQRLRKFAAKICISTSEAGSAGTRRLCVASARSARPNETLARVHMAWH